MCAHTNVCAELCVKHPSVLSILSATHPCIPVLILPLSVLLFQMRIQTPDEEGREGGLEKKHGGDRRRQGSEQQYTGG